MKLLSIIGTRPQYIKLKPFYEFCKGKVEHKVIDTFQHFSSNVSQELIQDLDLKIDFTLELMNTSELQFISSCITRLETFLDKLKPDIVLVFGDTNSAFCGALVAYKKGIPLAHVEAGERCFDFTVPEEANRVFIDNIASLKFCSSQPAVENVANGVFCGDLEYEYLNLLDPEIKFEEFGVMTLHRQENCNLKKLQKVFDLCNQTSSKIKFFVHHRIRAFVDQLELSDNIEKLDPCPYTEMVDVMARCSFIITDSGSLQKTAPFFGKRTLVMRKATEWSETIEQDFVRCCRFLEKDLEWLLSKSKRRDKNFYLGRSSPSSIILNSLKNF